MSDKPVMSMKSPNNESTGRCYPAGMSPELRTLLDELRAARLATYAPSIKETS